MSCISAVILSCTVGDDFIIGLEREDEARRVLAVLAYLQGQ